MRSEAKPTSIRGWHVFAMCCTWIVRRLHLGGIFVLSWHGIFMFLWMRSKYLDILVLVQVKIREPSEGPHEILSPLWMWGQIWLVPFLAAFIYIHLFTVWFFQQHLISWSTSSKVEFFDVAISLTWPTAAIVLWIGQVAGSEDLTDEMRLGWTSDRDIFMELLLNSNFETLSSAFGKL